MGLVERIKIVFDIDDAPGVKGLKSIRTEMANAEGAAGKLKAGFGGMTDLVKQNAVAFGTAAVAAFGAFAVKAGQAFRDTALEAGRFSDSTGIAVEDASRWREVAGDLDISAGAVEGSIRKMNAGIAAGKPVFDDLEGAVVRTKDGLVNTNETFIETIDAINRIKDPTDRAKAAQDAFGKGYGSMAELMKLSAEELRAKLAEVSDQKVIDQGELDKAKTWRERWDQLKDTFEDVQLGVGELVTSLSPLFSTIASGAQKVIGLTTAVTDFVFATKPKSASTFFDEIGSGSVSAGAKVSAFVEAVKKAPDSLSNFDKATGGFRLLADGLTDLGEETWQTDERFRLMKQTLADVAEQSPATAAELVTSMTTLLESTDPAAEGFKEWAEWVGLTTDNVGELAASLPDATGATDDAATAATDAADEFDHMDRVVADFEATGRKYKQGVDDAAAATLAWKDQLAGLLGTLDQEQIFDDFNVAMWNYRAEIDPSAQVTRDYKRELAGMIENLAGVPAETKSRMITYLEQGDIASVESYLTTWGKGITVPVRFAGQGSIGFEKNARGTDFSPGGLTLVGEEGAEFVDLPRGAKVYPAHETRAMQMASPATTTGTGSSDGGITMHTSITIGSVTGVDELDRRLQAALDARDQQLVQRLRAGIRG